MDDGYAVVGAPNARTSTGRAYVFERYVISPEELGWRHKATLEASDDRAGDWFGSSVALEVAGEGLELLEA